MKFQGKLLNIAIIIIVGLLFAGTVQAHAGGIMQIASQDSGPYKLTVWTSPDPATPGEIHVATAVASAETALPILDARVIIQLTAQDDPSLAQTKPATTEDSTNQFLYESIFDVTTEGLYEVTVTVSPSADSETTDQQGQVTFDLEVQPGPPLILTIIILILLAALTGTAVWLYLRWTQPPPETNP